MLENTEHSKQKLNFRSYREKISLTNNPVTNNTCSPKVFVLHTQPFSLKISIPYKHDQNKKLKDKNLSSKTSSMIKLNKNQSYKNNISNRVLLYS